MSRASIVAVCRAKAGSSQVRTGQAQELLTPGAFQRERPNMDFFSNEYAGYLRIWAKMVAQT